jgi:hypothetical protein
LVLAMAQLVLQSVNFGSCLVLQRSPVASAAGLLLIALAGTSNLEFLLLKGNRGGTSSLDRKIGEVSRMEVPLLLPSITIRE